MQRPIEVKSKKLFPRFVTPQDQDDVMDSRKRNKGLDSMVALPQRRRVDHVVRLGCPS